ncbi:hypothetical protein JCM19053_1759 [Vibrio sp. JCM 19053]|nr:hypothetical protein JCM19053_1759 [Vibrio sp. JCM 19053]
MERYYPPQNQNFQTVFKPSETKCGNGVPEKIMYTVFKQNVGARSMNSFSHWKTFYICVQAH